MLRLTSATLVYVMIVLMMIARAGTTMKQLVMQFWHNRLSMDMQYKLCLALFEEMCQRMKEQSCFHSKVGFKAVQVT